MAVSTENLKLAREALRAEIVSPNNLKYYLTLIQKQQYVPVDTLALKEKLLLDPKEAWGIITEWLSDTESNLSIPEKGSVTFKAGKLVESLEYKQETIRAASAVRAALQEKVSDDNKALPLPEFNSFQKALASQNDFYKAYNDHLLNPLTSKLSESPLLSYLSPGLRRVVASQLAANWPNYLRAGERNEITLGKDIDEISHLILHSSTKERNNLAHLINSGEGEKQLRDILGTIDSEVKANYHVGDKLDADKALADAAKFAAFSLVGTTLSNVSSEILGVSIAGITDADKKLLDRAVRSEIMKAAKGGHIEGREIIKRALDTLGVENQAGGIDKYDILARNLLPLTGQIEATQITMRTKYLGSGFFEGSNTRLLATDFVAETLGVDPSVPWLKDKDIKSGETALQQKYGATDSAGRLLSVDQILKAELAKGPAANPAKVNELFAFLDQQAGRRDYLQARSDGSYSTLQETFSKSIANFQAIAEPYERFYRKTWDKIEKVDDFIHYPQRRVAEFIDTLKERVVIPIGKYRVPVFGIPGFIADRWIEIQKRIAGGIFRFSRGEKRIASPFWRGIGAYTKAFVQSDGNFAHANFKLFEKGWGNVLNWASKKATNKTWDALKTQIGLKLWDGFSKMAPGLAKKFAGTIVQKLITTLGFATISGGTSLIIQAGLIILGAAFNFIKKWITNADFRKKQINLIPIYAALAAIPAMVQGIGAGVALALGALASFLGLAMASVAALLVQALAIIGVAVVVVALIFQVFKTTVNLDSGVSQLLTNVVCNLTSEGSESSGSSSSNPTVSAGKCIYDFLQKFRINPLTSSNAVGAAWNSFVTALGNAAASSIIQDSATGQGVFQCVGYIAGAGAMIGKPFSPTNACLYVNNPPGGYSWTTKPTVGCFFVIGSNTCSQCGQENAPAGSCGHVGIVAGVKGAIIDAMDANGTTPWGLVRITAQFPTSSIAGYMCP